MGLIAGRMCSLKRRAEDRVLRERNIYKIRNKGKKGPERKKNGILECHRRGLKKKELPSVRCPREANKRKRKRFFNARPKQTHFKERAAPCL